MQRAYRKSLPRPPPPPSPPCTPLALPIETPNSNSTTPMTRAYLCVAAASSMWALSLHRNNYFEPPRGFPWMKSREPCHLSPTTPSTHIRKHKETPNNIVPFHLHVFLPFMYMIYTASVAHSLLLLLGIRKCREFTGEQATTTLANDVTKHNVHSGEGHGLVHSTFSWQPVGLHQDLTCCRSRLPR